LTASDVRVEVAERHHVDDVEGLQREDDQGRRDHGDGRHQEREDLPAEDRDLARAIDAATREVELRLAAQEDDERYATDPVAFCREVLKFEPWSKQAEILESVRDNTRTAVRSSHGSGKSAIAARAVLWFVKAHTRARVITTAPTWNLVRDVPLVGDPRRPPGGR